MINQDEVYNSMQLINIYEKSFAGFKVVIKIPDRPGFFGEVSKNGQTLIRVFSHTDLYRVINSLNMFLSEKKYESYHVRFETVQANPVRPQAISNEPRVSTGTPAQVNASPKPQNLGNTQTKVSFDWGANV